MAPARTLALFGAGGRTGRELLAAARRRAWPVRALARSRSTLVAAPGLMLVRGDYASPDGVAEALDGADAACIVFGPRPDHPEVFCAAGTRAVVGAMRTHGPRRLLCLTGAMIGLDHPNWSRAMRWMAASFARRHPRAAADRRDQEAAVRDSGLDWTIFKPPRLTGGGRSDRLRMAVDLPVGLMSKVSRRDLAEAILDEIERPRFLRQAVFVAC